MGRALDDVEIAWPGGDCDRSLERGGAGHRAGCPARRSAKALENCGSFDTRARSLSPRFGCTRTRLEPQSGASRCCLPPALPLAARGAEATSLVPEWGRILQRQSAPPTIYTIGHSTRPAAELLDILRAFSVQCLVDIRSIPRSRAHPQFNFDVMPEALKQVGMTYVHLAALGGRRPRSKGFNEAANGGWKSRPFHNFADYAETELFREGLDNLLEQATQETCAIMCAEAVWWRCHRRIVTDHVLARGVPVVHLFTRTKADLASLTPFAVLGGDARVSYPARDGP